MEEKREGIRHVVFSIEVRINWKKVVDVLIRANEGHRTYGKF